MMMKWLCGQRSLVQSVAENVVWICSLLGIQSVVDVVRRGRLRWFGHLEHRSVDDWVLACRNGEVAGVRFRGGLGRLGENV